MSFSQRGVERVNPLVRKGFSMSQWLSYSGQFTTVDSGANQTIPQFGAGSPGTEGLTIERMLVNFEARQDFEGAPPGGAGDALPTQTIIALTWVNDGDHFPDDLTDRDVRWLWWDTIEWSISPPWNFTIITQAFRMQGRAAGGQGDVKGPKKVTDNFGQLVFVAGPAGLSGGLVNGFDFVYSVTARIFFA